MAEFFKALWAKWLYAWALPSAFAIGATRLFLLPQLGYQINLPQDNEGLLFIGLTVALAIILFFLSTHLYRVLEGYYSPRWFVKWGKKRELERKKALQIEVRKAERGWLRNLAIEKLARYPIDDSQILPTKFGNAIRAVETYAQTRFKLDSQTFWHELLAVSPKYIESEIDSARSSVDFHIALLYLSFVFGIACLVLGVIEFKVGILVLCVPAFLLTTLWHWLAIKATDAWAFPIRALVNLGRVKLADSLGLKLPETLEEEKAMWDLLEKYTCDPSQEIGKKLDGYRKKAPTEQRGETRADDRAGNGGSETE